MEKRFDATNVFMKIKIVPNNYIEVINDCLENFLLMNKDINTFLYLRSTHSEIFKVNKEMGGGNILSFGGILMMLNMLSKTFYILKVGFTEKNTNTDPNEAISFAKLVQNYPIDFGLKEKDEIFIKKFWGHYRDNLFHLNIIKKGGSANTLIYEDSKFQDIENIKISYKPIYLNGNGIEAQINVDQLNLELPKIKKWILSGLLENRFKNENILQLLNWYLKKDIIKVYEPSN